MLLMRHLRINFSVNTDNKSTTLMIVIASVVNNLLFLCCSLFVLDDSSLLIGEVAYGNCDEVDQCPDTATSASEKLNYSSSHFSDIESVYA